MYKNDYFFDDLKDYGFKPNDYTILTVKGLKKYGIDPNDNTKWSNDGIHPCTNVNQMNEESGFGYENPYEGKEIDIFYDMRKEKCSIKEPVDWNWDDEEKCIVVSVVVTNYEVENLSIGTYEFWGTKYRDKDTYVATPTEFAVSDEEKETVQSDIIDFINGYINNHDNDIYWDLQEEFGNQVVEKYED